jgi:hypothetical protein
MDKTETQYSRRAEYEYTQKNETDDLDHFMPEWILNLKDYFGKGSNEE